MNNIMLPVISFAFLFITSSVGAIEFKYDKNKANTDLNKLKNKIQSAYSNSGRFYVSTVRYKSALTSINKVIHDVKLDRSVILKPKVLVKRNESFTVDQNLTLVVHAYMEYDYYFGIKSEMDRLLGHENIKPSNTTVFLIADPENLDKPFVRNPDETGHITWMSELKAPRAAVISPIGVHSINVKGNTVNVIGGYWNGCHLRALESLIFNREILLKEDPSLSKEFVINLPLKAIFESYGNVSEQAWKGDADNFLKDRWFNKSSFTDRTELLGKFNYTLKINGHVHFLNKGKSLQHVIFNIIP